MGFTKQETTEVKIACAWCKRVMRTEEWADTGLAGADTSHTICPECFEKMRVELATMKPQRVTPFYDELLAETVKSAGCGALVHDLRAVLTRCFGVTFLWGEYPENRTDEYFEIWLSAYRKMSETRKKIRRANLRRTTPARYWRTNKS